MKKYLRPLVIAIALLTLVSGGVIMVIPALILELIGAEFTRTSGHFFSIIGMFMFLFGGLVFHATIKDAHQNRLAIMWGAFQKLGASAAIAIGIANDIFSPLTSLVAGLDFLSGILFLMYLKQLKN